MRRYIENNTYHVVFDNLHDFFVNTNPKGHYPDMHPNNQSDLRDIANCGDTSWRFGDRKNRETFYKERLDPTNGKNMCAEAVKKTMADPSYKKLLRQAMTYRKRIKYQDNGFRLNVSKAIAGEDKYFATYGNSKKPIVKIAINICGSASVNEESFKKVAATAVPTIYALETAGICTEVYYCAFSEGTHPRIQDVEFSAAHVKIKSAQERFSWTTFAPVFCLGSYRESIFTAWITSPEYVNGGLGCPTKDYKIQSMNNYGYTSIIGLNAPGPMTEVNSIFEKLGKVKSS